jgi:hypothetical protein
MEHTCHNCGNGFTELYCNQCGQKQAHRITMPHVAHDILHVFVHADKGILTFIPKLILTPGIVAKDFIEGKRKIFNPFQYLLLAIGVVVFLLNHSTFYEYLHQSNSERVSKLPLYIRVAMDSFNHFVQKYANLISFLSLPLFAFSSWLIFKAKGHNYAEHFTVQVFAQSMITTLNAILLLGIIAFSSVDLMKTYLMIVLSIVCFTILYRQLYNLSLLKAFGKSLLVFGIGYLVQIIIITVCMFVFIAMAKSKAH